MFEKNNTNIPTRLILVILFIVVIAAVILASGCSKSVDDDIEDTPDDTTAPAAVADLHVIGFTTTTATLGWTATGDDGNDGIAYEYDLRGSLDSITESNFSQAFRIDSVVLPVPAGYDQICTLEDLQPGESHYFAVKARDEADNWSGISNCVRVDCPINPVVVFPDAALDSVVREHIGLPSGDIHASDIDTVIELNGDETGISDLTGMEYFTSLLMLHLSFNSIDDLTPLQGLVSLEGLHINMNDITDLSPLVGLVNLVQISAGQNSIDDIAILAGLTKLQSVRLNDCDVTDFSPLYNLPALEWLDLHSNPLVDIGFMTNFPHLKIIALSSTQISDLTSLTNLTELNELYLQYNQITDITPLVNNAGLGTGDIVSLNNNPLSEESLNTHIPALQARGVTVNY